MKCGPKHFSSLYLRKGKYTGMGYTENYKYKKAPEYRYRVCVFVALFAEHFSDDQTYTCDGRCEQSLTDQIKGSIM